MVANPKGRRACDPPPPTIFIGSTGKECEQLSGGHRCESETLGQACETPLNLTPTPHEHWALVPVQTEVQSVSLTFQGVTMEAKGSFHGASSVPQGAVQTPAVSDNEHRGLGTPFQLFLDKSWTQCNQKVVLMVPAIESVSYPMTDSHGGNQTLA